MSRTVKLSWKTDKATGIKRETVETEVPVIEDEVIKAVPVKYFRAYLESVQDKMIRGAIEAGKPVVQAINQISLSYMLDYLEAEQESQRLTKEKIASWFDSTVSELLQVALAEKLGVSDTPTDGEVKKLDAMVAAYRDKLSALAGGKTYYPPEIAAKLVTVCELAPNTDEYATKFIERLQGMEKKAQDDLLAL